MLVLVAILGCQNPCQSLCQTMAQRASDCGLTVSQDELESCVKANEAPTPEWSQQCLDADEATRLEEWWTCDEVAENFTNGAK